MTDVDAQFEHLSELARVRWNRLQAMLPEDVGAEPVSGLNEPVGSERTIYLYKRNELLTDVDWEERVSDALQGLGVRAEKLTPRGGDSERIVQLRLDRDGGEVDVPRALTDLLQRPELAGARGDDARGQSSRFSPHHVFAPAPWNTMGPATEPSPPEGIQFEAHDDEGGRGVRVAILDTGLIEQPPGSDLTRDVELGDNAIEDPDFDDDTYIDPVAGHGTFIAGLIRQVAPGTTLLVEQMIDDSGVVSELDLATRLHAALDKDPDIINLSLGGHTDIADGPIALQSVWERLESQARPVVVVAAAGNNASNAAFWPAASAFAVGVGALGTNGQPAWFSNFGGWVDVWAPGEYLQSDYCEGVYRRLDLQELPFERRAVWSGTSFATPLVVGFIATLMSQHDLDAVAARDRLLGRSLPVVDVAPFGRLA
jgi:subtilisin family serine protease